MVLFELGDATQVGQSRVDGGVVQIERALESVFELHLDDLLKRGVRLLDAANQTPVASSTGPPTSEKISKTS